VPMSDAVIQGPSVVSRPVGSRGIKRRKPARHLPKVRGRGSSDAGWAMTHSPYTPEGGIESASKFGRPGGSPRRRRELRRMGLLLLIAPVVLFAIAVIVTLVSR